MSQWAGVVLAAGISARMNSRLPKVLHRVCGKEMIRYPVELLRRLDAERVVVVASPTNFEALNQLLGDEVEFVVQPLPTGTGDALALTAELLGNSADHLLVLGADSPLVQTDTVTELMASHLGSSGHMTILVGQGTSHAQMNADALEGVGRTRGVCF